MKQLKILLVVLLLLVPQPAWADDGYQTDFKIVGYYSEGLFDEPLSNLQLDKLTHVMYAFLMPDLKADGSLIPIEKPEQLKEMAALAHQQGAKVFIAIGGWSYNNIPLAPVFETMTATEETRDNFIVNVLAFVKEYDLDGVELDWEYPTEASQGAYEALVVDLSRALAGEGKELSAALNGGWSATEGPAVSKLVSDKCLEAYSFINVMCYDTNNADHSPLWFSDTSISYWLNRGMKPEQIVVGIPLYARPSWAQYRHLVALDGDNAYNDYAPANEQFTLESYYNGLNTIAEKTAIALRRAGGVMLFDVNEDTNDEYSVVAHIDQLVKLARQQGKGNFAQKVLVFLDERPLIFTPEENMGDAFCDENGRVLLPLRKSLEAVGATVIFDAENQNITISEGDIEVIVTIGSNIITVNGEKNEMDTRTIIKEGRTYLPARAVFEPFGYQLDWHEISKSVYLTKNSAAIE